MRRAGLFICALARPSEQRDDRCPKTPPSDRPRQLPPLTDESLPSAPERMCAAHQSQGPPRLLDKAQVCAIANVSFPTVWAWMRAGQFPRSRVVGGKSMWLSTAIEAWLDALPVRVLKGD